MKTKLFNKWMSHLCVNNADRSKHGSLLAKLSADFAMGKTNAHPDSLTTQADDVPSDHCWDEKD